MKKTLFTLFTAINLVLLYGPAALALTEDEAAAAVNAQGKDAVSGNLFLWLLCAIAFLKVSTKLDGILHSLGIGDEWVEHGTPAQLYALCGYDEEGILRALLAAGE